MPWNQATIGAYDWYLSNDEGGYLTIDIFPSGRNEPTIRLAYDDALSAVGWAANAAVTQPPGCYKQYLFFDAIGEPFAVRFRSQDEVDRISEFVADFLNSEY
jgi:hypothetical protein